MEIILNAGIGIGTLMFLLLLFKKNKIRGDYFFLLFILALLLQILFYQITIYQFDLHGLLAIIGFAIPLLSSPLLFLYILSLTTQRVHWKTILFHLSFYIIYVILILLFKGDFELVASKGFISLPKNNIGFMQFYAIPMAISGLIYSIWDLFLLKKHQHRISEIFSFNEKINLNWVRYLVFSFFAIFLITSFIIFGSTRFQFFPLNITFTLVAITLSIFLVAFGFYGFKQTTVFSDIHFEKRQNNSKPYLKSGLSKEKIRKAALYLEKIMQTDKPFLDEELNLNRLAEKSGHTASHLSQIINQHFKMNFYDFVNHYRIEEAKKMLVSSDYDKLSLLGIAFDCGFKSKSSFNRYFKKFCRTTPSEFKKNLDQ